jgi:glycosyltransferase involved in cell wall biosynthesis
VTVERRLRVLITTTTYPVHGPEVMPAFVHDLAGALTAHAEVTVLAPDQVGSPRGEVVDGVDVRRFPYFLPRRLQRLALREGIPDNLRASWLARLQVPGFVAAEALAMRRLVREKGIDVVNAHWLVPQAVVAAALYRRKGPALLAHGHGGDVYLLRGLPFGRHVADFVVRHADGLVMSGSGVREVLCNLVGREVTAALQPMGVRSGLFAGAGADLDRDGATPSEFETGFLLFVGRMIEVKGTTYLIRALPRIRELHTGLGLILIGDGPDRPRLEREVHRLGLQDAVRFMGRLPHQQIADHLRRCRAAVVPSITDRTGRTEGLPTVILEAMAARTKVIASAVGGIPDVVRHRENGWLCNEQDPESLASAVLEALEGTAGSVLERAAVTAARFDWEQVAIDYMGYLERAVATRRGKRKAA